MSLWLTHSINLMGCKAWKSISTLKHQGLWSVFGNWGYCPLLIPLPCWLQHYWVLAVVFLQQSPIHVFFSTDLWNTRWKPFMGRGRFSLYAAMDTCWQMSNTVVLATSDPVFWLVLFLRCCFCSTRLNIPYPILLCYWIPCPIGVSSKLALLRGIRTAWFPSFPIVWFLLQLLGCIVWPVGSSCTWGYTHCLTWTVTLQLTFHHFCCTQTWR